jgi:hypothetical protein
MPILINRNSHICLSDAQFEIHMLEKIVLGLFISTKNLSHNKCNVIHKNDHSTRFSFHIGHIYPSSAIKAFNEHHLSEQFLHKRY